MSAPAGQGDAVWIGSAHGYARPTNNARSEDMAGKASFRDCVKSRRRIIPANAICEWTRPQGSKTTADRSTLLKGPPAGTLVADPPAPVAA